MASSASQRGQTVRVGDISFHRRDLLGNGAAGTLVFQGMFGTRPVAVKRIQLDGNTDIEHEAKSLINLDSHGNVIDSSHVITPLQTRSSATL